MAAITSYDDPYAGSVVNQDACSYNGYQLVTETKQEHDGAVNASTLSVQYNYDDGASGGEARFVRLSSVEYPGGREVFCLYPASGIGKLTAVWLPTGHLRDLASTETRAGLSNHLHDEQPRIAVGHLDRRSCAAEGSPNGAGTAW